MTRISQSARIALVLVFLASSAASAQIPSEEYRGVAAIGLALRQLETTKRVLVIGAHPDDEDNQLLSALSLGQGADVAYLSLTRGEGGQNSIGGELGSALGVLRTAELMAARELDRSQQFFTRAYDFGFSRNAEETFQHWPRDSILADVVSVVRRYKPDVIVAIFTGTSGDGHGQHQVSGILAREAFTAAADPNRFPGAGQPHRTLKLFQATGYRQADPTQHVATGELDPLFGRSYAQIAAASRSRHRSQDMGQLQTPGPRSTSVRLLQSLVAVSDSTLFSGLDTTLSARARKVGYVPLFAYDSLIQSAKARLSAYNPDAVVNIIGAAVDQLGRALEGTRDQRDFNFVVEQELSDAHDALLEAAGLVVDVVSSVERIVPGESFNIAVSVWNGGNRPIEATLTPVVPSGWAVSAGGAATISVLPDSIITQRYSVSAPPDAKISQPYFLAAPRPGDYYAWPAESVNAGLPFGMPQVSVSTAITIGRVRAHIVSAPTRRIVDPRQGELRRAVHVMPPFALRPAPATAVVTLATLATGAARTIDAAVEIISNGNGGRVVVKPILPAGWRATPEQRQILLTDAGESQSAKFAIAPIRSAPAGQYEIRFVATDSLGRTHDLEQRIVDHPHIVNRVMFEPALMRVTVLDARFARGMRVGYVVGVDEPVAEVLEQMGVLVERLGDAALAGGKLGSYDAVVVGSRAYDVRPDLVAHNARILDYARKGGNLIVLYQQYEFIRGNYAPYALTIGRPHDRITDENAPVRFLDSASVMLTTPNRITQRDFENWVQERALYMPRSWASEYTPLLELNDPGEAAQRGAVLTARLGRGRYTYTGLAFVRQIPAGVPGALRLFINMISMGAADAR
ncbi:MAG: PIG-L family deacetylase [Gemmatimonadota bacterium]